MTQVNYSIQVPRSIQKITEHLRAILNSLGQLSRSPWASLLTFAVIGIALALPLSLFVLLKNIQVVSSSFQASGQINLYLQNNISDEQLHNTLVVLNMDEGVAKSQYISPQQGLQDFEQNSGLNGSALNLQSNQLPPVKDWIVNLWFSLKFTIQSFTGGNCCHARIKPQYFTN